MNRLAFAKVATYILTFLRTQRESAMSISSMTNVALLRRSGRNVATYRTLEDAAGAEVPQTDATAAVKAIASYIPTEILTVYVAVLAVLQNGSNLPSGAGRGTFYTFLILTPIVVWLVYLAKALSAKKPITPPLWEMFAALIAFAAWAFALPANPFQQEPWYSAAIAGIVVLLVNTALGLLAPIVNRAGPH